MFITPAFGDVLRVNTQKVMAYYTSTCKILLIVFSAIFLHFALTALRRDKISTKYSEGLRQTKVVMLYKIFSLSNLILLIFLNLKVFPVCLFTTMTLKLPTKFTSYSSRVYQIWQNWRNMWHQWS